MTDIDIHGLKAAAQKLSLPLSPSWMAGGIRHLNKNVDSDAFWDEPEGGDGFTPGRYEGETMATVLNAVPALIERLERSEGANGLNSECIGIMREHLAKVGIEATFADDVAAKAAAEITALRARVAELEQQVAALADALEDELKLARGWAKNSIEIHAASDAALRAAGRKT